MVHTVDQIKLKKKVTKLKRSWHWDSKSSLKNNLILQKSGSEKMENKRENRRRMVVIDGNSASRRKEGELTK